MLHVHRSERSDALVTPLADVLAVPPDDPFVPDVVAVPTRGIERWLAQRLSHRLGVHGGSGAGICANVDFSSPSRLVASAVTAVTGVEPDDDPWRRVRLVWPVLETIDASLDEGWAAPLARYVGEDGVRRSRRVALAQRVAELFAAYAQQRPALLAAWLDGRDDDGAGAPVPDDLAWQPRLWRRIRERVDAPGPAEVLTEAVGVLRTDPGAVDLPARLSVFGPTRLPEDQREVLAALALHRDVHLWLPHPSPALWQSVEGLVAEGAVAGARRDDLPPAARHALLASTARDSVELQLRLSGALDADDDGAPEVHVSSHPAPPPPGTLLGALQAALRADDPDAAPVQVAPDDRSVQVHACHGRARQVEVLREVLTGLFAADPTLEARDVIVMCPDVESFAPLVTATFGAAPDGVTQVHPGQRLRVSLADRGPGVINPVLGVLATLLRLADGRVTASEVLDLATTEPVRRRFRLSDDDLDRWRDWAVEVGVRWGEDGSRRERFGIDPRVRQGTWDAALDRVLLGVAMAEEDSRFVGPALPLDDVGSTDVDVAGRFAELVSRLTGLLADLDGTHPLEHWLDTLDRAVTLLADPAPDDAWQSLQAHRVLGDVRAAGAGRATAGDGLRLEDVRALLADRLAGRPTRAGFRTGALTVCSLEPMRAVPHRVVCLLGMEDGAFPRSATPDGDDLLARDPLLGERDRRSEDRQIFLDALTAAREHLVVLHSGADERTGAARPPAVPVAELLDALDRVGEASDGGSVRRQVVVRHPLQVVGERNFEAGALGAPGPFSFDTAAFRGAEAGRGARVEPGLLVPEPLALEASPPAEVDLDDLVAMLEHPVRWFLRTTLDVRVAQDEDEVDDRLPLTMAPLAAWGAGDRILTAVLGGTDPGRAFQAEWRRGQAPPRELGRTALRDVVERVQPVETMARQVRADQAARAVDVSAALPSGVLVTGTVPGVHGGRVVRAEYSKLGPKHRLRAWVQTLALAASGGDGGLPEGQRWHAGTVGRAPGRGAKAAWSLIQSPDPADAARLLDDLVALRAEATRAPLPLPPDASHAYAVSRGGGTGDPGQATSEARFTWNGGFEKSDAYHLMVWGDGASFDAIAGVPDEDDRRRFPDEPWRLGALARRVWDPLLAHEQKGTS